MKKTTLRYIPTGDVSGKVVIGDTTIGRLFRAEGGWRIGGDTLHRTYERQGDAIDELARQYDAAKAKEGAGA